MGRLIPIWGYTTFKSLDGFEGLLHRDDRVNRAPTYPWSRGHARCSARGRSRRSMEVFCRVFSFVPVQ